MTTLNLNNAYSSVQRIISLLLFSMCLFAATGVLANSTHARHIHVNIKSIDRLTRTYDQDHGPRKLIRNANTQFLHEWRYVSSDELNVGVHATVFFYSPLFGKPFATKVVWPIVINRDEL